MVRIFIPLVGPTLDDSLETVRIVNKLSTPGVIYGVEARLDKIDPPDIAAIKAEAEVDILATPRINTQGGTYEGPQHDLIKFREAAVKAGVAFVDCEIDHLPKHFEKGNSKLILSHHWMKGENPSMDDLWRKRDEAYAKGADIAKIVLYANNVKDPDKIMSLLRNTVKPLLALAMGQHGSFTRYMSLPPPYNSFATFAPLKVKHATADGQLPLDELLKKFNVHGIN